MQHSHTINTTGLILELYHIQTQTYFELPQNLAVISLGKPNDQIPPILDIANLPNAEVVSRIHAQIKVDKGNYFIEDLGSSNGTFINNIKLKPQTPYQINLGDKIELGQGGKVTFILQHKPQYQQNNFSISSPTKVQSQNQTTKLIGMALMIAGVIILTANIQVGIVFRIPGILLCVAGAFILFQRRINPNLGWILIALGIAVIVFTGSVFASINLLVILISSALLIAGYQIFSSGKIFGYDWRLLKGLIKK